MGGQNAAVTVTKLTSTDAFYVVDLPDAPVATGVVRWAKKILLGGAEDLARSLTYSYAVLGQQVSGASAGINAEPDGRAEAIAHFVTEVSPAGRRRHPPPRPRQGRRARRSRGLRGGRPPTLPVALSSPIDCSRPRWSRASERSAHSMVRAWRWRTSVAPRPSSRPRSRQRARRSWRRAPTPSPPSATSSASGGRRAWWITNRSPATPVVSSFRSRHSP